MNAAVKLEAADIQDRLRRLPEWRLEDDALQRDLVFADFVEAFAFMSGAALLAERMNHHPEWSNVYKKVTVRLRTHECDGISVLDFELAAAMDRLFNSRA